jgi:hypothetical protein
MSEDNFIKIKRFILLLASWACSLFLIVMIVAFLVRSRADIAILSLRANLIAESSQGLRDLKSLRNIKIWFKLKATINANNPKLIFIDSGLAVLSQLLNNNNETALAEDLKCDTCSDHARQILKTTNNKTKLTNLNQKNILYNANLIERIRLEIAQIVRRHRLLAKDFEILVGSPSAYSSDGKDELLYFVSGPFKWLPLLDTTKVNQSDRNIEIANFSVKLESLRSQSRSIVQDYEILKNKVKESAVIKEKAELELRSLNMDLSLALLEVIRSEL